MIELQEDEAADRERSKGQTEPPTQVHTAFKVPHGFHLPTHGKISKLKVKSGEQSALVE